MRKQRSKQKPGKTRTRGEASQALTVVLPAEFGIEGVAALHAQLSPFVSAAGRVVLEAPSPSRTHMAALQVLAAFFRTRAEAGFTTAWHQPPATLRTSAARLGLESVLGLI